MTEIPAEVDRLFEQAARDGLDRDPAVWREMLRRLGRIEKALVNETCAWDPDTERHWHAAAMNAFDDLLFYLRGIGLGRDESVPVREGDSQDSHGDIARVAADPSGPA